MTSSHQDYTAALDSVSLVAGLLQSASLNEEEMEQLRSNGLHLEIMMGRLAATSVDQQPLKEAVDSIRARYPDLDLTAPKEPVTVSMAQARVALAEAGILEVVDAKLDALPEPDRTTAKIAWEYSATMSEDSEFVKSLGFALDLSDEQISDLFRQAAKIKF